MNSDLDAAYARARSPIGEWLGMSVSNVARGRLYTLTFNESHIGNPVIRALHGGVIAAFLELASQIELSALDNGAATIRTMTCSIDYFTPSRAKNMQARVNALKIGRRIAFMEATGWQSDESRAIASARLSLSIKRRNET